MNYNNIEIICATCDSWKRFPELNGSFSTRYGNCANAKKVWTYTTNGGSSNADDMFVSGQLIAGENHYCGSHSKISKIREAKEKEEVTS